MFWNASRRPAGRHSVMSRMGSRSAFRRTCSLGTWPIGCFPLSKKLRKSPAEIAKTLAAAISADDGDQVGHRGRALHQFQAVQPSFLRKRHQRNHGGRRALRRCAARTRQARHGRVPFAQYQQALAPRAPAQCRAGHFGLAAAGATGPTGGQVHFDQRPRGAHLQEHARLGALRQRGDPGDRKA